MLLDARSLPAACCHSPHPQLFSAPSSALLPHTAAADLIFSTDAARSENDPGDPGLSVGGSVHHDFNTGVCWLYAKVCGWVGRKACERPCLLACQIFTGFLGAGTGGGWEVFKSLMLLLCSCCLPPVLLPPTRVLC